MINAVPFTWADWRTTVICSFLYSVYIYEKQEFYGGDMHKTKGVWHLRLSRIFPLTVGVILTVFLLNPDISIFHLTLYKNIQKNFNYHSFLYKTWYRSDTDMPSSVVAGHNQIYGMKATAKTIILRHMKHQLK